MDDPFNDVKEDVLRKVAQVRTLLESYARIRNTATDPSTSPELANTKADLEGLFNELADLDDLEDSVAAVELNPGYFNLTTEEVRRRRGFVDQIKDQIDDLRTAANDAYDESQIVAPKPLYPDGYSMGYGTTATPEDDDEFEQFQQETLMRDQDQQLEGVSVTVGNLQMQAREMGEELDDQAIILDDIDRHVDNTYGKVKRGTKRLQRFILANEDSKSNYCIIALIIILFILLFLVIFL